MYNKNHNRLLLGGGIAVCLLIAVTSLCLGNVHFTPVQLISLFRGQGDKVSRSILLYARLPRTLASLAAGAGLAVSGAVLQNVLANRLASPGIIGVNAGAGLGVTLCCAAGALSGLAVSCAAFGGSLITVLFIFLFSHRTNASKTTVILGGVALNSILNAVCESVTVLDTDVAMLSIDFRVGGFSAVSYMRLLPAAGLIALALAVLFTLCNELDVVTLGDETAQGVGLRVGRYRMLFLVLAALLAGAAVSFAGLLGFVGLIVPHFVRRFTGNESGRLLPMCAVAGAGFVTLCDMAARLLFAPYELPVGILMSVVGGPVFLYMLIRHKGGHAG
ncbi:iron ABC transporter permease [uncultured Acetatifactor sp.]|uniref:FecCD family ABC transporter permease n=1 Tax=uncultured Acetatifactor sp. TaxID=1671927 RepID=UPI002622B59D|nr:iron ABC transporter permease [uncultured Acetatifactor sp.]MCI9651713.1 iron ABC transporter permease [Lachnospiraceae bacterium]